MKRYELKKRNRELHPVVSVGLFFIVLGIVLLVAINDFLNLGSVSNYFTWQTALIFIGLLLIVNLRPAGGIIFISVGVWFFLENYFFEMPHLLKIFYWPGVIILTGISLIISWLFLKIRKN